jgi:protein tyrosine phosphatase (PTP) superfamily phosphohydrolase (DUF442 family)
MACALFATLATSALAMSMLAPSSGARDEPKNFVQWRPGLASSAQPSATYLARVKALGFDAVINLAPPQSSGSIASEFKLFVDEMQRRKRENVLVHCQVNMRGTAFVFLYRVIHENAPIDETAARLTGVWIPDRVWKKFIDDTLAAHGKKADIF